jgi:effector-binding domain-containing protein
MITTEVLEMVAGDEEVLQLVVYKDETVKQRYDRSPEELRAWYEGLKNYFEEQDHER